MPLKGALEDYIKKFEKQISNRPSVKGAKIKVLAKPQSQLCKILTEAEVEKIQENKNLDIVVEKKVSEIKLGQMEILKQKRIELNH